LIIKKIYKDIYSAKAEPRIIKVPKFKYITIVGKGNPNTSDTFKTAVEFLYGISYTIKFMVKKGETEITPVDYSVMPLEGQWWADDMNDFIITNKDNWNWKIMIMQPDFVGIKIFGIAKEKFLQKKKLEDPGNIVFEEIEDGLSAQFLYTGAYSDEGPFIIKLHDFIKEQGYERNSFHREIYLSDARKTDPAKLKTIIRQPIQKVK